MLQLGVVGEALGLLRGGGGLGGSGELRCGVLLADDEVHRGVSGLAVREVKEAEVVGHPGSDGGGNPSRRPAN